MSSTARKILLSVPTFDQIEPETTLSIQQIMMRDDVVYHAVKGGPTDWVRNGLVIRMMEDPSYTHVMMLDADVVPPANIVDLLLECDWPMATAIVPIILQMKMVSNVIETDHFMMDWRDKTEPFLINGAGAGCILVARKVFEELSYPWFRYDMTWPENKRCGEDIYFSKKAKDAGYQYKCNPRAVCNHIKKIRLLDIVHMANDMHQEYGREILKLREELAELKGEVTYA